MRSVLITGASGFIGRHCLNRLTELAGEVHALVRPGTRPGHEGITLHETNLFDIDRVEALVARLRPSHLLHLAWTTEPGTYLTSPDNVRWVESSRALLQSFAECGGERMVSAGSCAEYDPCTGVCREDDTPLRPRSLYGRCKNNLREISEGLAARFGIQVAWGRIFFLYGPHEHPRRLVASVIRSLLDGERARCSAGTQRRDFLHVADVADAFVALLRSNLCGAVNLASGEAVPVRTVVEKIAGILGAYPLLHLGALPARADEAPLVVADVRRLRHELGWKPRFDLERGLVHAIEWWRSNRHGNEERRLDPVPGLRPARPVEFLRRERVPVHQNLLLASPASARALARGELTMLLCPQCGFARNSTFDLDLLSYGAEYDNTQTHSPAFGNYVDGLVRTLVEEGGVRGRRIVEVGCGKGSFLEKLVEYPGADNLGFGFDPTYAGPEVSSAGRLHFERCFYDPVHGPAADVMVCRHVIEHVPAPLDLLRSMRAGLTDSADGRVFVETPCLEWILRHEVVWDFFYEHCSLFTAGSLAEALTRAGFAVISVGHVFDRQYLWAEARTVRTAATAVDQEQNPSVPRRTKPEEVVELARHFRDRERQQVRAWRERLRQLRANGGVAVWGAGAKGVTFCNLADPACESVGCVIDVNPAKQGNYVAGTGHPIVAPDQLDRVDVRAVVVLNPNYTAEIAARLARQGSRVAVIDLMRAG